MSRLIPLSASATLQDKNTRACVLVGQQRGALREGFGDLIFLESVPARLAHDVVVGLQELREIPYGFSPEWKTPEEVQTAPMADCKGKAVALYKRMHEHGARNVRLVIGRRTPISKKTHAWLEWNTDGATYVLDPTINWTAYRANEIAYLLDSSRPDLELHGRRDGVRERSRRSRPGDSGEQRSLQNRRPGRAGAPRRQVERDAADCIRQCDERLGHD